MRHHQCMSGGIIHQFLKIPPGTQVHFPAAFTGPAGMGVRSENSGAGHRLSGFFFAQARQQPVVDFLPIRVQFERDVLTPVQMISAVSLGPQ